MSGLNNGWVPHKQQAIIWNSDGLLYLRIYASLGLDELRTWWKGLFH